MRIEALKDQIKERYMLDLEQEFSTKNDTDIDYDKMTKKLTTLQTRIQKMEGVNLVAIQEYEETQNRYTFLSEQREDLLVSKEQLKKVIDKINRVCTKRFREHFEATNEKFQQVFPILFGGGNANISLIEPTLEEGEKSSKLLDMGVDITVCPPGKRLQNVSLLSGGEKALTASALLFSLFLVRPSPFCLLDEVDAPLDDTNLLRFNKLIKEMSKRSQVIMVTHNKYTMESSDRLYGVTMEEKGVSKIVSVEVS